MKALQLLIIFVFICSCNSASRTNNPEINEVSKTTSDTTDLSAITTKEFREFKVLDSKYIDSKTLWLPFDEDLKDFTESMYQALKPLIIEQDIPTLQKHIQEGALTYESLTKFYLYRIRKFDRDNDGSLNSIISLNSNIISEAKQKDAELRNKMRKHPIFGMPILLKDNVNASGMPTTAGAIVLKDNMTDDAFIVTQLKSKGALILGKTNLSEWAYFFCGDCPSGYSAIGGQTLNPYGRKTMDTGGSSSGSGVAVAANFCVAAIGSETAGSILSPASQNSVVGLKPTVGLLSRSGIIPISSTLDTPGPMTKNVIDNALMMDALFGKDETDSKSIYVLWQDGFYTEELQKNHLKDKRFGAFKSLMKDTLYAAALADLKRQGATVIQIEEVKVELPNFIRLLNLDMKQDLITYLESYANKTPEIRSLEDVIKFNLKDSMTTMPYGQKLFLGIAADSATEDEFNSIKTKLKANGQTFFDQPMTSHRLDAILSINNYHAAEAAVAEYPALTVPMGYNEKGAPKGLTFIAGRLQEKMLLQWAYSYEQASKKRVPPSNYN